LADRRGRWCVLALLLAAFVPSVADETDAAIRRMAVAVGQGRPLVRIGLDAGHRVTVSGDGAFRIVDPSTGEAVWRPQFEGRVHVVAAGGPKEGVPSVYRVQVGAYSSADAAKRELRRLEETFDTSGVVHHDPDRSNWRVRLGEADKRLELNPLLERLRAKGYEGIWIAEEPREIVGDVRLRLVDDSYESVAVEPRRLVVVTGKKGRIRVDGKPYRGLLELRVSPFGTVRPVNWIELEHYLLGVVPAELGPEVWPELAALQAQAVAARTYVQANLGQFEDEGFDLCATPRCQVYAGYSAEHPLSSRAVWSTKGEILVWKGEPIAALYTATCGGHTEDGNEIFPDHDGPYLKGVPCRAESEAMAHLRATLVGRRIDPLIDETGADVTRDWTLLETAGVIDTKGRDSLPTGAGSVDADALRSLTVALSKLAGRPAPSSGPLPAGTLAEAAVALVNDLGWEERGSVLLSEEDLPALLRDPELTALPPAQRRALAYLSWVEGLQPFADGSFRADRPVSFARLAPALVRFGESYEAFGLRTASVAGAGKKAIRLIEGKGELRLMVADDVALFGRAGGRSVPAERLELWPGDRVRFRTSSGAIDLLELMPPVKGASDDRSAKVYSWEVRRSRHQLERVINRSVSVGRLQDLQVVRRGVSGRVVELKVVGSEGSTVVRGFDVRRLLDLREILLVIEPQRDAEGRIEAVVFAGKGWGHGVGLCQVGAYGMAVRGAGYREILGHYYRGARLERSEPGTR